MDEETMFRTDDRLSERTKAPPEPPADLLFDDDVPDVVGKQIFDEDGGKIDEIYICPPAPEETEPVNEADPVEETEPADKAKDENKSEACDDTQTTEEAVIEDAVAEEEEPVAESVDATPEWVGEYAALTNAHFQNLRALIKNTKTKDASILKLSNELEKYREEYFRKAFKSIGMAVISFREDCRKSIADIEKYRYDAQKVEKYLGFLVDEYDEMLSNIGVEEGDDGWLYNGRPLKQTSEEPAPGAANRFAMPELTEEAAPEMPTVKTADDLLAFLKAAEDGIQASLKNNELLDQCLKAYIELSFDVEKDLAKVVVYPVIRSMIKIGKKLKTMVEECRQDLTEENCNIRYTQCLSYLVYALEFVLLSGGISIDDDMCDTFDAKKNRVSTRLDTDDETLDRKIAAIHTECYVMNDKVIYPSRVDVYKFVPQTPNNK